MPLINQIQNAVKDDFLKKITTGAYIGLGEFYKAFRAKKVNRTPPAKSGMNKLRGFFVPQQATVPGYDATRMLPFQFNPAELGVSMDVQYATRNYPGLPFVDYVWTTGGQKLITFTLFLDATAGSQTGYFVAGNPRDQSIIETLQQTKPNGVMPELDLLTSFRKPEVPDATGKIKVPQFNSGGIVAPNQFYAPPILIFVYGQFYLVGHLAELDYRITLFDEDLIARRAEVNVGFAVHEQVEIVQNPGLSKRALGLPTITTNFNVK